MGKKKKIIKLAENNMKILKNGKLKISKGQKIDLTPFINGSVEPAVVSRIDGIISQEDVVIDTKDIRVDIDTNLTNDFHVAELLGKSGKKVENCTIAVAISKKEALEVFNFLDEGVIGTILRTSTLASVYTKLKPRWAELNEDDKTSFTNVMYIPNICSFIDPSTGKVKKAPMYINLLVVAVPSLSKMDESGLDEKVPDEDAAARVIADIVEAGIKCGCKDLIVNPFCHKFLCKDEHATSKLWAQVISGQRVIEQYNTITFAIENDDQFIIFNAARK